MLAIVFVTLLTAACHQTFADHTAETVVEPMDMVADITGAFDGATLIGTARINYSDSSHFENRHLYDFDALQHKYGKIAFVSKHMFQSAYRNGIAGIRIAEVIFDTITAHDIDVGVMDCNSYLVSHYERLGFVSYKGEVHHPDYGLVTPLIMNTQDIETLRKVRSPLLQRCLQLSERRCNCAVSKQDVSV